LLRGIEGRTATDHFRQVLLPQNTTGAQNARCPDGSLGCGFVRNHERDQY